MRNARIFALAELLASAGRPLRRRDRRGWLTCGECYSVCG